jgi:hypothetical protein
MSELTDAYIDSIVFPALVGKIGLDAILDTPDREFVDTLRRELFLTTTRWLCQDLSLQELGKLLEKWSRVRQFHSKGNCRNGSWYPLIPETILAPGVKVVTISSCKDLIKEGERMENCLRRGSHITSCLLGTHHILTIRKNDQSLLNLTLISRPSSGRRGAPGWTISECKGIANNANLSPELAGYLELFRSKLENGHVSISPGPFGQTAESFESLKNTLTSPLERILGLNLREPAEEAMHFFREILTVKPDRSRGTSRNIHFPILAPESIPECFERFIIILTRTNPPVQ